MYNLYTSLYLTILWIRLEERFNPDYNQFKLQFNFLWSMENYIQIPTHYPMDKKFFNFAQTSSLHFVVFIGIKKTKKILVPKC